MNNALVGNSCVLLSTGGHSCVMQSILVGNECIAEVYWWAAVIYEQCTISRFVGKGESCVLLSTISRFAGKGKSCVL